MDKKFSIKEVGGMHFVFQMLLTLIVVALCIGKITLKDDSNKDESLYWSTMLSLTALWLPSPLATNSKKSEPNPDQ